MIGDNGRAERAASDAELAERKAASDAEWRIAHGWPDPRQTERVPNEWDGRTYICPDCGLAVSQADDSPDRGRWRHRACAANARARRAPRPPVVP